MSKLGHRTIGTQVGATVEAAYHDLVKDLATGMAGWTGDNLAVLTLTEDARQEFERIAAEIELTLGAEGELALLVDRGSKYAGAIARIAGILHLAEHGAVEEPKKAVSVETIVAATLIGEYFKASAVTVFTEMGTDQVATDAISVLQRIHPLSTDEVSERDVFPAASRGRFKTTGDRRPALHRLVEHGYLIPPSKPKPTGGPPASPRFMVVSQSQKQQKVADD